MNAAKEDLSGRTVTNVDVKDKSGFVFFCSLILGSIIVFIILMYAGRYNNNERHREIECASYYAFTIHSFEWIRNDGKSLYESNPLTKEYVASKDYGSGLIPYLTGLRDLHKKTCTDSLVTQKGVTVFTCNGYKFDRIENGDPTRIDYEVHVFDNEALIRKICKE